jgi:hypothetical protein
MRTYPASTLSAGNEPRIVMVLKARDEGDVIEQNLRFHRALGVAHFICIDHESADETGEVMQRWEEAGLASYRRVSGAFETEAAGWMQDAARAAASDHDAEWVLHGDADEFWTPAQGSLPDALAQIPPEYGAVVAPRSEHPGRSGGEGPLAERLAAREARSSLRQKLAYRGDPEVVIVDRGAHNVAHASDDPVPLHGAERAVLRAAREPGVGSADVRFTWAPVWPLRVHHFPVRSPEQVRRRMEIQVSEFASSGGKRSERVGERLAAGGLAEMYAELVLDDRALAAGLEAGELVRDNRVAEVLRRAGDGEDPREVLAVRLEPTEDELRTELADLERDAMRAISRAYYRLSVSQQRLIERVAKLERRVRRLRS